MVTALVTGAAGFIGKNLVERLQREQGVNVMQYRHEDDLSLLYKHLRDSDVIYHLAGVNRPQNNEDFEKVNKGLTEFIIEYLSNHQKKPKIVFSSSTQAENNSPYGLSKKAAEEALKKYSMKTGAEVTLYRLPGVFGKWCRPHYNSVVATFCHNLSHDRDIVIDDENKTLELAYIDDVVDSFTQCLYRNKGNEAFYSGINQTFHITLGELAHKLYEIRDIRKSSIIPDLSDDFTKRLHATYLSYLDKNNFSYRLPAHKDERGSLFELIKSQEAGQIFVSTSRKGVIRGNHYHDTKVEKFCVIKGEANIQLRKIHSDELITYVVSDQNVEVVDIPPGYTHSIENLSHDEMIVLFWANELFDPENPDTFPLNVQPGNEEDKEGDYRG